MIKLNKSTANEIAEYLLDNNKILIKVLNGKNGFDDKEYIRIAVKTKEENDYFIQSIKEYYDKTGNKVGFKPAGGINTVNDAVIYYTIVKEVLGECE